MFKWFSELEPEGKGTLLVVLTVISLLVLAMGKDFANEYMDRQVRVKAIEALSKNVELKINTEHLKELLK